MSKMAMSTTNTITDAGRPSTAMNPWAVAPERTPPDSRVYPVSQSVGKSVAASSRSTLQKSMCQSPPKR